MERGDGGTRQARHEQSEIKTANPTDFIGRVFASVFALSGSGGQGCEGALSVRENGSLHQYHLYQIAKQLDTVENNYSATAPVQPGKYMTVDPAAKKVYRDRQKVEP